MLTNPLIKIEIMRKLSVLLLGVILCFISCSDDDKNNDGFESKIVGKWQITEVTNPNDYEPCDYRGWMQIKADHTLDDYDACDGETSKSTWKLEGNELTFVSEILPIPFVVEIVSVDDSKMVVKFNSYGKTVTNTYKRL